MICAVILAAGKSARMGRPKMLLPWGSGHNVLSHLIHTFKTTDVQQVFVVIGAHRTEITESVKGMNVRLIFNPDFEKGEMISSVKVGLIASEQWDASAVLLCPGDLPLLNSNSVQAVIAAWQAGEKPIVAPSYENRRGHPLLVSRDLWPEIISLGPGHTLREFLSRRGSLIDYAVVEDPGVMQDMDTYEDYTDALDRASG